VFKLDPCRVLRLAVNVVKSLWASVQGDPVFMRRVNGWLTVFWIAMIPVSLATGWVSSVQYVSALSLWALVSGHWSAWQAARVEVEQQREVQEHEQHPTEQRVVDALVRQTTVERATARATGEMVTTAPGS
jgi:hypothetical protein